MSRRNDRLKVLEPKSDEIEGRRRGRRPDPALAEERRRQILEAARGVFTQRGYRGATMSEIARAANLGKGTLYWYWRSKEDLLYDLMEEVNSEIEQAVREALTGPGHIIEKLQRAFGSVASLFAHKADLMRLFRGIHLTNEEALRGRFAAERLRLARRISALTQLAIEAAQARGEVPAEIDSRLSSQVAFVFLEGLAMVLLMAPEEFDLTAIHNYAIEQFFSPLLSKEGS